MGNSHRAFRAIAYQCRPPMSNLSFSSVEAAAYNGEPLIVDMPILAIAQFGQPSMASFFLDAGANVNALGRLFGESTANDNQHSRYRDVGVFDYVVNARTDSDNILQLVSIFVDRGANVNHRMNRHYFFIVPPGERELLTLLHAA